MDPPVTIQREAKVCQAGPRESPKSSPVESGPGRAIVAKGLAIVHDPRVRYAPVVTSSEKEARQAFQRPSRSGPFGRELGMRGWRTRKQRHACWRVSGMETGSEGHGVSSDSHGEA
jgi:hypothetical protein